MTPPPEERFWSKVDKSGECWVFQAAVGESGYPKFTIRTGLTRNAHRAAWILTFGDPGDLDVLHRCDNRLCVRPKHLYLGTASDNVADMDARGRRPSGYRRKRRGQDHHNAKLADAQVAEIRAAAAAGETQRSIAARFGISHTHVGTLVRGARSMRDVRLAATMATNA